MRSAILLFLIPLAAFAQEPCIPVPYATSGSTLSADGGWLAAAGLSGAGAFQDPLKEPFSLGWGDAVSIHGGRMAVAGSGKVRMYHLKDGGWEPAGEFSRSGVRSVALGEDWLVVGTPEDGASHEGAVYLYRADTLALVRPLRPGDGRLNDRFGASVAVDGDTVVVGAPYADDLRVFYNFGAAYVFDAGSGSLITKLRADSTFRKWDIQFGAAVAVRGGAIVVGAPGDDPDKMESAGSAHLFTQGPRGWEKTAELTHAGPTAGRQLGISVAIDDAGIAVGALGPGAAYLFKKNGDLEGECVCGGRFGRSVALWTREKREVFLGDTAGVKGCFKIPDNPVKKPLLTCEIENPPASVPAGKPVTFTVLVRNEGTAPADPARVEVGKPDGVDAGRCDLKGCSTPIPDGQSRRFRVTFDLPPDCKAPASIQPRAFVWSGTTRTACVVPPATRIERVLGVHASIELETAEVVAGVPFVYHLRLENGGPGTLEDEPRSELIQTAGLLFVDAKVVAGGGRVYFGSPSGFPLQDLHWNGSIPPCGKVDIRVTAVAKEAGKLCLDTTFADLDGRMLSSAPTCFQVLPGVNLPSGGTGF
ncbi:MAG TPA: hypothetical protein VH394_20455 [Thermoanaerobaculia bacterium]|jgi:hypothetical protein|nr:hypothetical protein [Thermoanaerobaculia bacterium]